MQRSAYDTDVTTWSPQGRLHQVEYAMEAVKFGSCGVGVRSDTFAVVGGFKRIVSKLADYNDKVYKIDDHMGLVFSGISADARFLTNYMRLQCLNHKYIYNSPHPVGSLVEKIGSMSQNNTQRASKRPFGCGLIIGGVDALGPHIYETCPSGNYTEYYAIAFGTRSHAAKTYLENHHMAFHSLSEKELIRHTIEALKKSVAADQEMTLDQLAIGTVGVGSPWKELTMTELLEFKELLSAAST